MKIFSQICFICLVGLILSRPVLAADPTASPAPSKAQDLLNRVSDKVSQLVSKLHRTYVGKIKTIGSSSYIVTTAEGDKTITTNDVTSFYRIRAGSRSEVNFPNLKVGDDIVASGTVDPNTSEMTAKQIIAKIKRQNIVGTINSLDKNVLTVAQAQGTLVKIDLSDALSLKMVTQKNTVVGAKTESFAQGDFVFAIAYSSDASSQVLSVLKAIELSK